MCGIVSGNKEGGKKRVLRTVTKLEPRGKRLGRHLRLRRCETQQMGVLGASGEVHHAYVGYVQLSANVCFKFDFFLLCFFLSVAGCDT